MSATEAHDTSSDQSVGKVDMKLENQIIPVSDVDRSKQFYERLGWRIDDDVAPLEGLRIVQFTPPRSGTSVTFGLGLTTAAPGSAEASLTVSDIEAAHDELVGRGIGVNDIWHGPPFPVEARQPGPDPERASYGRFSPSTIRTGIRGSPRRSRRGVPVASGRLAMDVDSGRFCIRRPSATTTTRRPTPLTTGGTGMPPI